jgi:non-canonical purine NTP pyrophosphatase (RdgB/HAM1 family)
MTVQVSFITSNPRKFEFVRSFFSTFDIPLEMVKMDAIEPQTLDPLEVATHKLSQVRGLLGPVLVQDSGLHITALNGFPGALVKYFNESCGATGYLGLLHDNRGKDDRRAQFKTVYGYRESSMARPVFFTQIIDGHIAYQSVGQADPIYAARQVFVPVGQSMTAAEMGEADWFEYMQSLPQAKALRELTAKILRTTSPGLEDTTCL